MHRSRQILAVLLGVGLGAGCASAPRPSPWGADAGAPSRGVLVMPMQVDRSKGTDVATASELTELLVDKLQGHHVPTARFEGELSMPAYQLACEVTDMASTQTRGYPRHVRYKAELNCTIKDPSTHEIRWQRRLDQEYEEAVLFNMMTKRQERHDWVLYRECVVPLWDAMAYGVKLFLSRPTPQAPEAPPPEIPAEPVPSLYVK